MAAASSESNRARMAGVFAPALKKVLTQVHEKMDLEPEGAAYIEGIVIDIFSLLCFPRLPLSTADVQAAVPALLPAAIAEWAIKEADAELDHFNSQKKKSWKTEFPVDKIQERLGREASARVDLSVCVYLAAILDYISADLLKLAGDYARACGRVVVTRGDLEAAVCSDKALQELVNRSSTAAPLKPRLELTYAEAVKEFYVSECEYLTTLNVIIKVFLEYFESKADLIQEADTRTIFVNIREVQETALSFVSMLEDSVAVGQEHRETPFIGLFMEDLAAEKEFDVYLTYARGLPTSLHRLRQLCESKPVQEALVAVDPQFLVACKYELADLLVEPLVRVMHYVEAVTTIVDLCPPDRRAELDCFRSALSSLKPLAAAAAELMPYPLQRPVLQFPLAQAAFSSEMAVSIQRRSAQWEGPDLTAAGRFFGSSTAWNAGDKKKSVTLEAYVFENAFIFCKSTPEKEHFKFKARFNPKTVALREVREGDNTICLRVDGAEFGSKSVTLLFYSEEERTRVVALLTKHTTIKLISTLLQKRQAESDTLPPGSLPDPRVYPFAEPDSESNIRLETDGEHRIVKGGSLVKLVERLTHHTWTDPQYQFQFLFTFRTFCTPEELLDLLILRYNIPAPADVVRSKLFTKVYVLPVRLRVVNFLKQWIEKHYIDFERLPALQMKLFSFIRDTLPADPAMRSAAKMLSTCLRRRTEGTEASTQVVFKDKPPGVFPPPPVLHILTINPIELARQITLFEFEMFRKIQLFELLAQVKQKGIEGSPTSINLQAFQNYSNLVTQWVKRSVLELETIQERVDAVSLFIEVLQELLSLRNFNAIVEIAGGLDSSSVRRLSLTWAEINPRRRRIFEECLTLLDGKDNYLAQRNALAHADPPCVPFLGTFHRDIVHSGEGNSMLPVDPSRPDEKSTLINFGPRRKAAQSLGNIAQFQHQPYCLDVEPVLREYIQSFPPVAACLAPFTQPGQRDDAFENVMHEQSKRLEPGKTRDTLFKGTRLIEDAKLVKAREAFLASGLKSVRHKISLMKDKIGAAGPARPRTDSDQLGGRSASIGSVGIPASPGPQTPTFGGESTPLTASVSSEQSRHQSLSARPVTSPGSPPDMPPGRHLSLSSLPPSTPAPPPPVEEESRRPSLRRPNVYEMVRSPLGAGPAAASPFARTISAPEPFSAPPPSAQASSPSHDSSDAPPPPVPTRTWIRPPLPPLPPLPDETNTDETDAAPAPPRPPKPKPF